MRLSWAIAGGRTPVILPARVSQTTADLTVWVLPDQGGILWSQSLAVFKDSKNKDLAFEFVKYVMSPEGQARLATSSCFWGMPANAKAGGVLSADQKKRLRWDEQEGFLKNSHRYFIPDAKLDAEMLDVWTEFLQH